MKKMRIDKNDRARKVEKTIAAWKHFGYTLSREKAEDLVAGRFRFGFFRKRKGKVADESAGGETVGSGAPL